MTSVEGAEGDDLDSRFGHVGGLGTADAAAVEVLLLVEDELVEAGATHARKLVLLERQGKLLAGALGTDNLDR